MNAKWNNTSNRINASIKLSQNSMLNKVVNYAKCCFDILKWVWLTGHGVRDSYFFGLCRRCMQNLSVGRRISFACALSSAPVPLRARNVTRCVWRTFRKSMPTDSSTSASKVPRGPYQSRPLECSWHSCALKYETTLKISVTKTFTLWKYFLAL